VAGPEQASQTGAALAAHLRKRWTLVDLAANVLGALVVFAFIHAFRSAEDPDHGSATTGLLRLAAYLAVAPPLAWTWRERRTRRLLRWLSENRPAELIERDLVLREPLRALAAPATIWGVAAVAFGPIVGTLESSSAEEITEMTVTATLGGVTTCALVYLLTERLLRPVTAIALACGPPERPSGPGVRTRLITAWALASGVPLLGLGLLALRALGGHFQDTSSLAIAVLVLTGGGLAAGAIATTLSASSLAEPITAVREALARVRKGDLDVHVAVDDGSELGLLQAGFNDMAAGLRERERLRDLFGRHVGEDVARRAVHDGVALGGEVREVAALFVDLVGSTDLASRQAPKDVVALLNRFFAVVVDVVEAFGGWVNRFEGDGALCVFGAPTPLSDAAGSALAAGRTLRHRVRTELPKIEVGIGISAGPAVAGNVGAERRLEYTVIGDAINEAARLCELAKRRPDRVLASGTILARASADEKALWCLGDETILRGRSEPTRLATPAAKPTGRPDYPRGPHHRPAAGVRRRAEIGRNA
jgi:adenylate cyclase